MTLVSEMVHVHVRGGTHGSAGMDVDPILSGTCRDKSSEPEQAGRADMGNAPVPEGGVPTGEANAHHGGTEDTAAGDFGATGIPPASGSNGTVVAGVESTVTTVRDKADKGKPNNR